MGLVILKQFLRAGTFCGRLASSLFSRFFRSILAHLQMPVAVTTDVQKWHDQCRLEK
jgi:hypothetical protein